MIRLSLSINHVSWKDKTRHIRKEIFYSTMHSTHYIYVIWDWTSQVKRGNPLSLLNRLFFPINSKGHSISLIGHHKYYRPLSYQFIKHWPNKTQVKKGPKVFKAICFSRNGEAQKLNYTNLSTLTVQLTTNTLLFDIQTCTKGIIYWIFCVSYN